MNWGIGSYTLPWHVGIGERRPSAPLTAQGLLEIAVEEGAQVVQYCENLPITRLSSLDRGALLSMAKEAGIQIQVGTRGLDAEELEVCADLALKAGSSFVRVVVDRPGDEPTPEELGVRLQLLAPLFRRRTMILAIENHDRFPANVLAQVVRQGGEDWLGICFDTANSLGCLQGPHEALQPLLPYVVNLHLKDVVSVREGHMLGFRVMGAPLGEGVGRLKEVASLVAAAHPQVTAVVEHWLAPAETIEETLDREREWTRRSCSTLRTWFGASPVRVEGVRP